MFEQKCIDQLFDDGLFIVGQLLDFFKLPKQLDITEGLGSLLICGAVHQVVGGIITSQPLRFWGKPGRAGQPSPVKRLFARALLF